MSTLLADSYIPYLMTYDFHRNVTGPMFNTLHLVFMEQFTEQWNALDVMAERIRALGHPAPGTYKEFVKAALIKEQAALCCRGRGRSRKTDRCVTGRRAVGPRGCPPKGARR